MAKYVSFIVSLLFLSIYIMFSYESVSYQKNISKAMIETNRLAMHIQKNGYDEMVLNNHPTFSNIDITLNSINEYDFYCLKTIMTYRCEISFFKFSSKDIITEVCFYAQ